MIKRFSDAGIKYFALTPIDSKSSLQDVLNYFKKDKPLIVIDGVISSEGNLKGFNPINIQSINILKGDNATTKYAEKGANGVVEITTKKN